LNAQVGIGTTSPDISAALDLTSTDKGILIPRMSQAQRTSILSPATGLFVYQLDAIIGYYYFDGTIWKTFSSSGWALVGEAGTAVGTNKIGTLNTQDLVVVTNNIEAMRLDTSGNVGVGTTSPTEKLHIVGTAPVFRFQDGNENIGKVLTTDASGVVSWETMPAVDLDDDWEFFGGGSTLSDKIYHRGGEPFSGAGGVVFGRTGTTTHNLHVDNGAVTGTTFGLGNEEYIEDGNNEILFSHSISPDYDNFSSFTYSNFLGVNLATSRWTYLYSINTPIITSDGREKKNVSDLNYGLSEIMQLRPVTYKWKEEKVKAIKLKDEDKREILGLIAQEVQQIIPEVVHDEEWKLKDGEEDGIYEKVKTDRLGVTFVELLPVLIKAKQEHHQELLRLQKENEVLLKKVLKLKAKKK